MKRMRLTTATLLLLAATAHTASAQPAPATPPDPVDPEPMEATAAKPAAPADDLDEPPARSARAVEHVPPSAVPAVEVPDTRRPNGFSVGIGIGWNFPTDLQVPNAASVRFRLGSGLTIEPELALARGDASREDGLPPPENVTSSQLTLGMQVRKPLRYRGKADLELLGGIRLAQSSVDPEGEENTDSQVSFTLNYGLAVGVWATPHVQVSITATNPIVTANKETDEQGIGSDPIKTTSTTFGAVWDPDFILMVHLHL